MKIAVTFQVPAYKKEELEKEIKKIVKEILKQARVDGVVEVAFVDNQVIKQLNRKFRKINKVTDVLSFPLVEDVRHLGPDKFLGDVIISLEQATKNAKRLGHSLKKEVLFLVAHGSLHLLGYDHKTKRQKELMQRREREILCLAS